MYGEKPWAAGGITGLGQDFQTERVGELIHQLPLLLYLAIMAFI